MSDLRTLGLGKTMEKKLCTVGIRTAEELKEAGSREAVFRLKTLYPGTCVVILYHLEAALQGMAIKDLPPAQKAELKAWFARLAGQEDCDGSRG